jgi:hypothetical protein
MAVFKHAAEIFFDEPAEDGVEAEGEPVFNVVAEKAAVAIGEKFVAVAPVGEGALFLDVGEEAVVLVFGVDGDPGFVKRAEQEAKLDAGADGETAGAGDDPHLLPRGEEELKDVVAFVEGEDLSGGEGEARLMEVGAVGVHYPFCDAA